MRLRPRTIALIVKAHIAYTSSLKTMPKMLALVTPDSRDPGTVVQSVYSIGMFFRLNSFARIHTSIFTILSMFHLL